MPGKKFGKRRSQIRKLRPVSVNCPFCKEDKTPDYKDYETLRKYITERAKSFPRPEPVSVPNTKGGWPLRLKGPDTSDFYPSQEAFKGLQ